MVYWRMHSTNNDMSFNYIVIFDIRERYLSLLFRVLKHDVFFRFFLFHLFLLEDILILFKNILILTKNVAEILFCFCTRLKRFISFSLNFGVHVVCLLREIFCLRFLWNFHILNDICLWFILTNQVNEILSSQYIFDSEIRRIENNDRGWVFFKFKCKGNCSDFCVNNLDDFSKALSFKKSIEWNSVNFMFTSFWIVLDPVFFELIFIDTSCWAD